MLVIWIFVFLCPDSAKDKIPFVLVEGVYFFDGPLAAGHGDHDFASMQIMKIKVIPTASFACPDQVLAVACVMAVKLGLINERERFIVDDSAGCPV